MTVTVPALGGRGAAVPEVAGRVKSVGRSAGGSGRLFPVVTTLEDPGTQASSPDQVAAGMTAEVVLELRDADALTVPVEAVVNPGGQRPALFKVLAGDGGYRVAKLAVEVGNLLGDRVIVYGPLAPGDRVVVGGQRGLLDGEPVEIE